MNVKKQGKALLCRLLERQVIRLRRKHTFTIVAVAGSVGKTSTKLAIARVLGTKQRVRFQEGNYNDRLTVPLVVFGHREPGIFNLLAWARILVANERIIRGAFESEIVVLELGTDGPGQIAEFAYLRPEIVVVTAIADEHMEYFGTLDAVAQEELAVLDYADTVLLNIDDIAMQYLPKQAYLSYGFATEADYRVRKQHSLQLLGQQLDMTLKHAQRVSAKVTPLGTQGAKIVIAAAAVADLLGWPDKAIVDGVQAIAPVSGRMQVLAGAHDVTLLDDTYNASPVAVRAALDVLYAAPATQRIAILGSMNELGDTSPAAHELAGSYCDASKVDMVVTIGEDAERYLAPRALKNGCQVKSFTSPYEAGAFVADIVKPGAVVLAKGSQNGVFAEESLKSLLKDASDAARLVRQTDYWMRVKQLQFPQ